MSKLRPRPYVPHRLDPRLASLPCHRRHVSAHGFEPSVNVVHDELQPLEPVEIAIVVHPRCSLLEQPAQRVIPQAPIAAHLLEQAVQTLKVDTQAKRREGHLHVSSACGTRTLVIPLTQQRDEAVRQAVRRLAIQRDERDEGHAARGNAGVPSCTEEHGAAERDAHRHRVIDLGQRPRRVGRQRVPVHGSGVRVGGPALEGRSVRRGAVERERLVAEARHVIAMNVAPRACRLAALRELDAALARWWRNIFRIANVPTQPIGADDDVVQAAAPDGLLAPPLFLYGAVVVEVEEDRGG
eukprot:scaffold59493_cov73-Phaeocystis_antarctica.AAC.9